MASYEINPKILNLFPDFDGESELLEDYIDKFNRILNAFSLNKVKGMKILKLKVTGIALRALKTAEKARSFYDYQSLVTELGKLLATEGSVIKAKYGLALEMKESESLEAFAERIRRNVKKAYPQFSETHQESLMADSFVRGLRGDLREKLMHKTYLTLEDALAKAESESDRRKMTLPGDLSQKIDKLINVLDEVAKTRAAILNPNSSKESTVRISTPSSDLLESVCLGESSHSAPNGLEKSIDRLIDAVKIFESNKTKMINFMSNHLENDNNYNEDHIYEEEDNNDRFDERNGITMYDNGLDQHADHSDAYPLDREDYEEQYDNEYETNGPNHVENTHYEFTRQNRHGDSMNCRYFQDNAEYSNNVQDPDEIWEDGEHFHNNDGNNHYGENPGEYNELNDHRFESDAFSDHQYDDNVPYYG